MKRLATNVLIALTIIPLFGSCGKSSPMGDSQQRQEEAPEGSLDGSTIDGLYLAKFKTLNPHVNGTIPGSLTFFRQDDRLMTYVRLFAGGPRAWHQQGVYLGKRCPTLNDDLNRDGFIDIAEAMKVIGKMIIPLDANMNSQMGGRNFFPLGDLSGYYHYERVSSFRRFFSDLRSEDLDSEDHIAKLGPNEKFTFEGRVVLVQGVVEETILPETVAAQGRRPAYQALPITCGVIKKVKGSPALPDTGVIPGPVADVVEGQDHPAPGEEDTPTETGGTVAGTTGTNENEEGEVGDEGGSTSGETSGGTTTGETTGGGSSSGTTGGGTTGGGTTGGGTSGGESTGGFIGGFIGGSSGGTTSETSGGTASGGTTGDAGGRRNGGFIGGFIGGSSGGSNY